MLSREGNRGQGRPQASARYGRSARRRRVGIEGYETSPNGPVRCALVGAPMAVDRRLSGAATGREGGYAPP